MSFSSIALAAEGSVTLQLSARSVGLFEAFYSSLKPLQLMRFLRQVVCLLYHMYGFQLFD